MATLSIKTIPADSQLINRPAKILTPAKSICPCHPAEVRSERFAVLDTLINARWGSVPLNLIEFEAKKRGRILVSEVPEIYLIVEQATDGFDVMRLESTVSCENTR